MSQTGPNSASGRIKVATKDTDSETGTLDITFATGAQLSVALEELSEDIVRELTLHGLSQKIGDSYASVKGDASAAFDAAKRVIEQLKSGEWKVARASGEGKSRVSELAAAIARIKGVDVAKAAAAVAQASEDTLKLWRGNAKVKAAIADIRAEKAAARAAKAGDDELELDL